MQALTKFFHLKTANSTPNQELQAGITTFLTMAYILVVNPAMLSQTGMAADSVFLATCLSAALGCMLVGILANYPLGVAPGMGLNAYFVYQITSHNLAWPDVMGLIFISSTLLMLVCITPIKSWILDAIPTSLSLAISSGIGVFIGFVALKQMGLIKTSPSGVAELGELNSIPTLIAIICFMSIIVMESYKVRGAIIIAIVMATLLNLCIGSIPVNSVGNIDSSIFDTFFGLTFSNIKFDHQTIGIVLTFLFVVLFDSTGTLIAIVRNRSKVKQELIQSNHKISNALLANSITCIAGSVMGTTPTTPYIESASGIKAGGKTGLTAVTIGCCFLLAIIISPLIKLVPIYATAPALLFVACLMIEHLADIKWNELQEAIPAALTLMMIPFTFSIADGIGFGIISYCGLQLLCKSKNGETKAIVHPMMWVLSIIFILFFTTKYL